MNSRITADPNILVGKPIVAGTRISVEMVLEKLASKWSVAQIVEAFPVLTEDDVIACIDYAIELVAEQRVEPIAAGK
jgi:uncharacterized protein (DUF433 family)